MMALTQTLPKAWIAFKDNKKYLIIAMLFEFLFIFTLTQIHLALFLPSAEVASKLSDAMTEQVQTMQESDLYQLETMLYTNKEFMSAYHDLAQYIGLFVIGIFAAWLVFRAPVWYLSYKSILKKTPAGISILKFCLLSLFWFAIIMLSFIIYSTVSGSGSSLIPIVCSTAA